jgi:hypothetical protein
MPDTINLPEYWLERLDKRSSLTALFKICQTLAFYIVDKEQHVLYWSPGAERLTGANPGKSCPPEFTILADTNRMLHAPLQNGRKLTLHQSARLLYDRNGAAAGGVALLTPAGTGENQDVKQRDAPEQEQNFQGIISRSPAMRNVFQIIRNAARCFWTKWPNCRWNCRPNCCG